jgi:hypothetical protein
MTTTKQHSKIKRGDILPCGGVVSSAMENGYYYRPKGRREKVWVATSPLRCAAVDLDAVAVEREAALAEREAFANRDMTEENAAAEEAKRQFAAEVARILAIAGVSSRDELMRPVPWAADYLPVEEVGELVVYNNTGETRGVWDRSAKEWVWSDQNNRGNRDDDGCGYGSN